jgi:hypothetical protein
MKLEPKDLIQAENSARMTLVQTIGGAGLLIGILFSWRMMRVTVVSAESAADKQITELFSKALEQIGNKDLTVRVGGIFTLSQIARQSRKDHWPIMEILTAHLRKISPTTEALGQSFLGHAHTQNGMTEGRQNLSPPRSEVEAIVDVLRLRNSKYETEEQRLNLEKVNLEGMDLSGANLRRARFLGSDLRKAKLYRTHLEDADFSGSRLCGADLTEARLNGTSLLGADLEQAVLIGADLRGALIYATNLTGASLMECKILHA